MPRVCDVFGCKEFCHFPVSRHFPYSVTLSLPYSRDFIVFLFLDTFRIQLPPPAVVFHQMSFGIPKYRKCLETAKVVKFIEYQKCLETGIKNNKIPWSFYSLTPRFVQLSLEGTWSNISPKVLQKQKKRQNPLNTEMANSLVVQKYYIIEMTF